MVWDRIGKVGVAGISKFNLGRVNCSGEQHDKQVQVVRANRATTTVRKTLKEGQVNGSEDDKIFIHFIVRNNIDQ